MGWQKRILLDGKLADFVRRYDALLRLNRLLERGQFVSARRIAFWLGSDVKQKLDLAKKQEKLGTKEKPEAVKLYEIELQRADMMHKNAQKFVSRGKFLKDYLKKLQAHRNEAARLYQLALNTLKQNIDNGQQIFLWFDRPLNFTELSGIRPDFADMPRVRPINEIRKLKGITNQRSKRGNWLHLKRDLVMQEIARMQPIYFSLQAALADIESSKWGYSGALSRKSRADKNLEMAQNCFADAAASNTVSRNKKNKSRMGIDPNRIPAWSGNGRIEF